MVSCKLKMVSPRHAGSIEICATYEQEMKVCSASDSFSTNNVCRNNFQWATTWNIAARKTFGRRPLDYYAVVYVLQCTCRPLYRDTYSAFYAYWSEYWSTGRNRRRHNLFNVLSFDCFRSNRCISSALSLSLDKPKAYWMLYLAYGSHLWSCVRHPWRVVVSCLVWWQRIHRSRSTMLLWHALLRMNREGWAWVVSIGCGVMMVRYVCYGVHRTQFESFAQRWHIW